MNRKEAIREYKERKIPRGIFAVRCTATGQTWVGSHPNLEAARNGLWSFLRAGDNRNAALQSEWSTHGEAAFQFEILEKFDDDLLAMDLQDRLKKRRLHWAAQLDAKTLLP